LASTNSVFVQFCISSGTHHIFPHISDAYEVLSKMETNSKNKNI